MMKEHRENVEVKMMKENQKKAELSNPLKAWNGYKKEGT